jgi:hypothetical protein
MAADNDLYADASDDLDEMKRGFSQNGTNLIVFADLLNEHPSLMEIGLGKETVIKSCPELNSADPTVLKQIIQEVIEMYPAPEYGLILWSHGTSWLPAGIGLRSFGKDGSREMDISELAEALPLRFSFILFDACLMGSVEVAYELKDRADYIIASSTETVADGFPYDRIIPELIRQTPNLTKVATDYFDFYNEQTGVYRSATVSVISTQELEQLAYEMKQIITAGNLDISAFDRTSVQRLDVYAEQYHFDLLDFVTKAFPEADRENFITQLRKTVLYKNSTPRFLQLYDITAYCGLSCFIPHPARNDLNGYYRQLKWFEDSGLKMQQLMEGMKTADVPAPERRTNVEPIDKTKPGQENLSEKPTPKERLPP